MTTGRLSQEKDDQDARLKRLIHVQVPNDVLRTRPDDFIAWYVLLEHGDIPYSFTQAAVDRLRRCMDNDGIIWMGDSIHATMTYEGAVVFKVAYWWLQDAAQVSKRLSFYSRLMNGSTTTLYDDPRHA